MELLAFSPSDDGEDMDVLEYEDADSELVDEDMRSTTASIENMEDDATVSVEDMDDAASSSAEGMSDTASSSVEDMDDADSAEEDIATRDDEDQDSDSSLEYESNGDEAGPLSITTVAVHEKMKYMSVGFYDTEEMAERSLHQLNQFDYSYKTRYVLTFRVGKEFECHSHNGCHHRIKIVTHQAGEMVDCGGISVERSGTGYVQRFRPWLYMFVKTESIVAYERMFRALVKYAREFLNLEVKVHSVSTDHSDAISSALELVWPRVEILTCWEHFLRQSRKQTKLEKSLKI
ncbi:hypothetical protein Pcac1_g15637 [Phytophthora cactorum]|uniref:MULE transposase domain-containing protein n=1 Tax=Phytophthora cactorum TaxID=29920 RepID=A0A329RT32_9STRA|nr:hypothetical protein Pcac1_g15637 [Phytophthora cactorum]RAW26368.1 hypothetical protein PC110_g17225 [Phytophthora cactorum]